MLGLGWWLLCLASIGCEGVERAPRSAGVDQNDSQPTWLRSGRASGALAAVARRTAAEGSGSFLQNPMDHDGKWVRAGIFLFLLFAAVGASISFFLWLQRPSVLLGRSFEEVEEDRALRVATASGRLGSFPSTEFSETPASEDRVAGNQPPLVSVDDIDDEDLPAQPTLTGYRSVSARLGARSPMEPKETTFSRAPLKSVSIGSRLGTDEVVNAAEVRRWIRLAKSTKLDIYTCLGLANGHEPMSSDVLAFIPAIVLLLVMQGVLPVLLMFIETRGTLYPIEQDPLFRIIGFILYVYSVLVLYEGASDQCRSRFLEIALHHDVSYAYILPMLFGEVVNSVTGFFLARTLYLIFISSHRPLELLIQCIAINFVILIDNEWTTEEMRHQALDNFEHFYKNMIEEESKHLSFKAEQGFKYYFQVAVKYCCVISRVVGILAIGIACAFLFLFSNQDDWCGRLGSDIWPVCIPADQKGPVPAHWHQHH